MDRQAQRRAISGVGSLFEASDVPDDTAKFLGSCFSLMDSSVFATAAHCIEGIAANRVWVNHFGGPDSHLFTQVRQILLSSETDIAVFSTEAPATWATPFPRLKYAADPGEGVCAAGYFPDYLISIDSGRREALRFFQGHVQRPFMYEFSGRRYSAYELSFTFPTGVSGAPLFLEEDPGTVIGVMTATFESVHDGEVISCGVAANIFPGTPEIEEILGRALPDPELEHSSPQPKFDSITREEDRLYRQSGQFSSTVKDSQSVHGEIVGKVRSDEPGWGTALDTKKLYKTDDTD